MEEEPTQLVDQETFTYRRYGGFSLGAENEIGPAMRALLIKYINGVQVPSPNRPLFPAQAFVPSAVFPLFLHQKPS